VSLYGACLQPRLCLIMEYCKRGSIFDLLKDPTMFIGWSEALGFALQMSQAIASLHLFQILHRDVKSMNFLVTFHFVNFSLKKVDENWCIKVCDFGLSRIETPNYMSTLSKLRGTMIYCPPEICRGEPYVGTFSNSNSY
jgi:serine/threonine protein kinase